MYDQGRFLETLSRFAVELPSHYDIEAVLSRLTESVTEVLFLHGSGVTLAEGPRLRFVTAVSEPIAELERLQESEQSGPCREAFTLGDIVTISDVRSELTRWPPYVTAAVRLGIAGVAGLPMRLGNQVVGALNLYSAEQRSWTADDIAVARVLADVATSYVVNASKLRQQEQLNEQLQMALDSRVVIEQAKGITANQRAVSLDDAFALMRTHARNNHASVRAVAEAIVTVGLRV
jgi:GAF domain-containing protein